MSRKKYCIIYNKCVKLKLSYKLQKKSMEAWFLNRKKEKNKIIKKQIGVLQKYNPLWIIKLDNKELIKELRDWLLHIQAWFVIVVEWIETEKLWENIIATWNINESDLIWYDFIICDDNIWKIDLYTKNWITPIVKNNNQTSKILKEFNPMKNEWNSFFYESDNKWSIFATIIKYTENYKFPFDNKNLVNNVLNI